MSCPYLSSEALTVSVPSAAMVKSPLEVIPAPPMVLSTVTVPEILTVDPVWKTILPATFMVPVTFIVAPGYTVRVMPELIVTVPEMSRVPYTSTSSVGVPLR